MLYSESIVLIAKEATVKHGDDINSAINEAEALIRATPEFKTLVDKMVRVAVQEMVYTARHQANVQLRKEAGQYGGEAKVKTIGSTTVQCVYNSVYNYYIGGKTLGNLMGEELEQIALSEAAVADGHMFNAKLCMELKRLVSPGKLVKDVVPERKLRTLFKKVKSEAEAA